MYIDPVRHSGRPTDDRIPQEMAIYDELERQGISFERVDHDHADTMEDCRKIEEVLDAKRLYRTKSDCLAAIWFDAPPNGNGYISSSASSRCIF